MREKVVTKMDNFQYFMPNNITELVDALGKTTDQSKILAGGTDLVISLYEEGNKEKEPDLLIDLSGIKDINQIKSKDGRIYIGGTVTFAEISKSELLKKHALCLVEAARGVGSPQIRNRGTLGGNIVNASPAGDSLPALIVLGAQVEIINSLGIVREISIEQVLVGVEKSCLNDDEVIIGVNFAIPHPDARSTFVKIGNRSTVTIARLSLAVLVDSYIKEDQLIKHANVALGAVGKTALRAPKIERLLENRKVTTELRNDFAHELSIEIENAIPGRYSLPYKKEAIKGIAHQAFDQLFTYSR